MEDWWCFASIRSVWTTETDSYPWIISCDHFLERQKQITKRKCSNSMTYNESRPKTSVCFSQWMKINDFLQGEEINLKTYQAALENDWRYEVWRSSDSVVISFNVQASLHHGAGTTHISTPHESALKENLVPGRQTSRLNRGCIETGLFTAFNFLQKPNCWLWPRGWTMLVHWAFHQRVCWNTELDYDYSITLRDQRQNIARQVGIATSQWKVFKSERGCSGCSGFLPQFINRQAKANWRLKICL